MLTQILHSSWSLLLFTIILCPLLSYIYLFHLRASTLHQNNQEDNNGNDDKTVQPYTCSNHPYRTFMDKLTCYFFAKIMPLSTLANHTNRININDNNNNNNNNNNHIMDNGNDVENMMKAVKKMRKKTEMSTHVFYQTCKAWNALIQKHNCDGSNNGGDDCLVGGTVYIPRNRNILSEWGIVDYKEPLLSKAAATTTTTTTDDDKLRQDYVEVTLLCPLSTINGTYQLLDDNSLHSKGFKMLSSPIMNFDELKLSSNAEYMINFHGGGMVLGTSTSEPFQLESVKTMLEMQIKKSQEKEKSNMNVSTSCPPVIFLSVNYRLAPEYTFPCQIIDGLSVSSHILNYCKKLNSTVHFCGCSAGGNLSCVVGFESFRHYGNKRRIKSIVSIDPMLLPAANSNSYYMNSKCAPCCPVDFLRWCWGTYLELEPPSTSTNDDIDDNYVVVSHEKEMIDFHSLENYTKALNGCKWTRKDSKFNRLISPKVDLPPSLKDNNDEPRNIDSNSGISPHDNTPIIIIRTSKADALHDDGIDLISTLVNHSYSQNLYHFDNTGSHIVSSIFDKEEEYQFLNAWSEAIW